MEPAVERHQVHAGRRPVDGPAIEPITSCVDIEVDDTGVGIAPDFLPHVFDRFRQADSRTTRERGGLGLGLAIVRHVVELHGGTVSGAERRPGKGATFTIELPLG